ncbi:hypothetical protein D3C74_477820 [compost metagenome]
MFTTFRIGIMMVWNGTTIAATNSSSRTLLNFVSARTIRYAAIALNKEIRMTLITVTMSELRNASPKRASLQALE